MMRIWKYPELLVPVIAFLVLWPRASWASPDKEPPLIDHERLRGGERGRAITIRAQIEDASGIFAPSVYVRPAGSEQYLNIPMKEVLGAYQADIPADVVTGDLEYFIEAFDTEGNGPSQIGGPDRPLLIRVADPSSGAHVDGKDSTSGPNLGHVGDGHVGDVPPEAEGGDDASRRAATLPSTPPSRGGTDALVLKPGDDGLQPSQDSFSSGGLERKWWFWTLVALAVTGGAVAAVAAATTGQEGPVDNVNVVVRGPNPSTRL